MTIKLGYPATAATSGELAQIRTDLGLASQAEAEAGADASKLMTPQRVAQAILAQVTPLTIASQAEAEAGTNNTKGMTPLRVYQAILALASGMLTFVDTKTASGYLKTEAGDPGTFLSVFCSANSGGTARISIYDGSAAATGNPIGIGTYPASTNGVVMSVGQHLSLGAAVSCPNGIWVEISGTATYSIVRQ